MFDKLNNYQRALVIYDKILNKPLLAPIIKSPAIKLPMKIVGNVHLKRIFIRAAIRLPVHTPVPGTGIATKIRRPHTPYFLIFPLLDIELPVSLIIKLLNSLVFFR